MDIKKIGKIIFPVCKGGFKCKMMWRIPKSWSQCSTMLTFWEIGSFLKKMAKWGLWQKTINFFIKLPISQKLSVVVHRDQLFWIPRIILHQKHSFSTGNNFFFNFFNTKMTFLPLLSQRPWLTHIYLNLAHPKQVLHKLGRFFYYLNIIK